MLVITVLAVLATAMGDSPSPCTLPVITGRCEALLYRYAYYKDEGVCREFVYGGCGANANNFRSLHDCQVACIPARNTRETSDEEVSSPELMPEAVPSVEQTPEVVSSSEETPESVPSSEKTPESVPSSEKTPEVVSSSEKTPESVPSSEKTPEAVTSAEQSPDKRKCPNEIFMAHYTERGCEAVFDPINPNCPVRYDCSKLGEQKHDKCYYKGREYNVGDEIPEDVTPHCLVHCRCVQYSPDQLPSFTCVSIECAELFLGPLMEPNCVRQYSEDECCSTSTFCAAENETLATAEGVAKCDYGGTTYIEGQNFYPDEEPCMKCSCKPGFNGKLEAPYCKTIQCNLELHYTNYLNRKCVPVYFENRCCPISWRCPDQITIPANEKTVQTEKDCLFGDVRFSPGEILPASISGDCVTCSCAVGPVPTCVRQQDC